MTISCSSPPSNSLVIACAANVQFAMEELCEEFEVENDIKTSIIIASSGKLTAQIIEGAPYDIFISADMKFPNKIFSSGKGKNKPEIYAYGRLMLISTKSNVKVNINSISSETIKHIAIANPKTAPYGKAAYSALNYYSVYDEVEKKLVYGESVSQTNQFISTGAAEIGLTSYSSLKAFGNDVNYYLFDQKCHLPIEQGVVLIKHQNSNEIAAQKFYLFLFSQNARKILAKYGYQVPQKL